MSRVHLLLASAAVLAATPANAAITFIIGNSPGSLTNVHLIGDTGSDFLVNGTVGTGGPLVDITNSEEHIQTTHVDGSPNPLSQGVTWVGASTDATLGINNLTFALHDGSAFQALEFSLNSLNGEGGTKYAITLSGLDGNNNPTTQTFTQDSGGHAIKGDQFINALDLVNGIKSVTFTTFTVDHQGDATDTPFDVLGVGHIRMGVAGVVPSVPEPATWSMMILGAGMAGAALRRRSSRKLAVA